ncbi:hypothetical protein F5B20DRAFT_5555 [Whalleya microplaca]|nr:hypothetical protein F5B20DRAFT_5555 [Whalleya microplaca]
MASRDVLKISAYHYKQDHVSDGDFEKWFHEVLTPQWVALVKKHNVLRYTATYTPSSFHVALSSELSHVRPGWQMGGGDIILTYYVRGIDEMRALPTDPEYNQRGRVSEKAYIDASKGELRAG